MNTTRTLIAIFLLCSVCTGCAVHNQDESLTPLGWTLKAVATLASGAGKGMAEGASHIQDTTSKPNPSSCLVSPSGGDYYLVNCQ